TLHIKCGKRAKQKAYDTEARSRRGRASKSNEELCHELLEFNLAMGLPENRVPSMKELCENGRFVGSIRCFVPLAL
ncbi:hypothetical protein BHE74_00013231, partial [Ensete ventricosum]